jgi:lipopolysaccharide transport system ATP-binding protein
MLIKTTTGEDLGGAMSAPTPATGIQTIPKNATANVEFEFHCRLNPGKYHLNIAAFGSVSGVEFALHGIKSAEVFRVVATPDHLAIANIDFGCKPSIQLIESIAQ